MHTKSHLYVLDQWHEQAQAKQAQTQVQAKQAQAPKKETGKKKPALEMPTVNNLLGKGAAAAAKYINTFGTIKHHNEEDF